MRGSAFLPTLSTTRKSWTRRSRTNYARLKHREQRLSVAGSCEAEGPAPAQPRVVFLTEFLFSQLERVNPIIRELYQEDGALDASEIGCGAR